MSAPVGAWGSLGIESAAACSSSSESGSEDDAWGVALGDDAAVGWADGDGPGRGPDRRTSALIDDVARAFGSVFKNKAAAARKAAAAAAAARAAGGGQASALAASLAWRHSHFQSMQRRVLRKLRTRPLPHSLAERRVLLHPRPALIAAVESAFVDRAGKNQAEDEVVGASPDVKPAAAERAAARRESGASAARSGLAAEPGHGAGSSFSEGQVPLRRASSAAASTDSAATRAGADASKGKALITRGLSTRAVVRYTVVVEEVGRLRWRVPLRYSDFFAVNQALKEALPGFKVPFPPKSAARSMFGGGLGDSFVRERRLKLNAWLEAVLRHPRAFACAEVRALLSPRRNTTVERVRGVADLSAGSVAASEARARGGAMHSRLGSGSTSGSSTGRAEVVSGTRALDHALQIRGRGSEGQAVSASVSSTGPLASAAELTMEGLRQLRAPTVADAAESAAGACCAVFVAMREWDSVCVWPFGQRLAWREGILADGEDEEGGDDGPDGASAGDGVDGDDSLDPAAVEAAARLRRRGRAASAAALSPAGGGASSPAASGAASLAMGIASPPPQWRRVVRHGELRRRPIRLSPAQLVQVEGAAFGLLASLLGRKGQGFMRRNLLALLRRVGRTVYSGTMAKGIKASILQLTSVPQIASYVGMIKEAVWPGGVFPTSWPLRMPDDEFDTRDALLLGLLDSIPASLYSLLGRSQMVRAVVQLHTAVNCAPLMRSLAYTLLDTLFQRLVPAPPAMAAEAPRPTPAQKPRAGAAAAGAAAPAAAETAPKQASTTPVRRAATSNSAAGSAHRTPRSSGSGMLPTLNLFGRAPAAAAVPGDGPRRRSAPPAREAKRAADKPEAGTTTK
ncbi:hypothetical protein FNF29_01364 [Cafeteria roenbergensis]|uniref:PX domain-containing protein n=1 Tax=Cafeteria roenbergensis TaxID=33653 RepID=A0A5A8CS59_CAFRO|nr:hypothetical protein FNF29_01364 [Cafeteria roenbergensis]|eukprot:KAA0155945.1 hypothetical protein FNF29_01364 [Cafeteria roenbergensis]